MNELRVTGKVLNRYVHESGVGICKIAVPHEHDVIGLSVSGESVFNVIMIDRHKFDNLDFRKGDTVLVTGYIKADYNNTGHKSLKVYATNIEVTKPKFNFDMVDYTRQALGM